MKTPPILLPLAERVGRRALRKRGFETRWVSTPHAKLHVYEAKGRGTLPTMVVLHGLGAAATPFAPLLGRLAREAERVVAPDLPGHGFSDESTTRLTPEVLFEAVTEALDRLIHEPAIVIGNSLGGAVALHYAATRPQRVRALVLVSPAGARASDDEWKDIRDAFAIQSRADANDFLKRLYHAPPWFLPLVAHEFPAAFERKAIRDILASATNEHSLTPETLASLAMPILFLWGSSERLLPHGFFDYFSKHLPSHAVIERPEGFGHCPHFDAPADLAARIVSFARTV